MSVKERKGMKKLFCSVILNALLACSCATQDPFYVGNRHGSLVSYGDGLHPGIDFNISSGTPIIAVSDGIVISRAEPDSRERYGGGFQVRISHGNNIDSNYMHLSKVIAEIGQSIKRGDLIGLSGVDNGGYAHLHFGVCRTEGSCKYSTSTYNPDEFWLGGKPQCFDPNKDYSGYSRKEMTLPVACGDYAKALKSKAKKKD